MSTPTISFRRTRFAPSPSGYLHLGNARSALFNRLAAAGGEMLLRIEDTDAGRSSESHIAAIIEDLHWLGLSWTGDDAARPWRQSALADNHARALADLLARELAYPCFCTPQQLQAERQRQIAAHLPPRYSGRCAALSVAAGKKRMDDGEAAAIRFRMPPSPIVFNDIVRGDCRFVGADIGDFVLCRANGAFSFFFANAIDDAHGKITHVLRGEDHLSNTPRQLAILQALNLSPPQYGHLPLMTAADGGPLSKRDGALSVRDLRAQGFLPMAVINYLARVGCALHNDELHDSAELATLFSFLAVNKSPAAYDPAQLLHWQKRALQQLTAAEYETWMAAAVPQRRQYADFADFCAAVQDNVVLYADVREWARIIFAAELKLTAAAQTATMAAGKDFYTVAANSLESAMEWKSFCERIGQTTGTKGKGLFLPLRAALTGRTDGPAMPPLFKLIGMENARRRLTSGPFLQKQESHSVV